MALPNIFNKEVSETVIHRINNLKPDTQPQWGKMNVSEMLAHCNVTYEMVYENKHPKPNFFMKAIMTAFIKKIVTNETPYKRNGQTAPAFKITDSRHFETENKRLINYIAKTQELGADHFDNKESHGFGTLSITEWNNMFYKHLDHHLTQFGV
ncbi:DUF1569 domain-containing protein [Formosa algae]|uniref:DUF1569 domain-containing protein n=1 Tax=Formosa algae TaxID=225843 RepID=A0A9X0YKI3_9FLAO|nr:DUF1569 domain-containing protein [Formosa algae]MBP1838874.1 hypothetical protein [Formosa algae]MDQ0333651.1 hypothetical protein [Formosa algae]OEI78840.1 hypothetical protein AST99_16825 [Formosa algae]PNW26429.1 hypothetical protein BKP44_17015 [Formosa algae]